MIKDSLPEPASIVCIGSLTLPNTSSITLRASGVSESSAIFGLNSRSDSTVLLAKKSGTSKNIPEVFSLLVAIPLGSLADSTILSTKCLASSSVNFLPVERAESCTNLTAFSTASSVGA